MVGAGLSTGTGYEFKEDGTYIQTFLATSSRPDYKIFLYTKGTYKVFGTKLTLTPIDLYYRKWEDDNLVTNEHSVPPAKTYSWSIRPEEYTGKLYLLQDGEKVETNYCKD